MASGGPPPVPKKQGLSPWAWLGIGCAGILVVGGVVAVLVGMFVFGKVREVARDMEEDPVATMSRMIAAAHPEVELVEADKDARTVTFRNTTSDEVFTFSYKDIEEGRFSFSSDGETARFDFDTDEGEGGRVTVTTDEGTATFGAGADVSGVPDWVPVYPGSAPQGTYSSETPQIRAGSFGFETSDGLDSLLDFYTSRLEAAGLEIRSRTKTPEGAAIVAAAPDESRTATVTLSKQDSGLGAVVNFMEKK